ncbi:MAG: DUF4198 domain-containing protein [Thermodesulfovibrionales bacterium]|nr:DUF4198 domain-containing protein [Thermodesulfovibrionales bacterium]
MKKITFYFMFLLAFLGLNYSFGWTHFGVIMPSDDIVSQKDNKKITLQVKFIHPFEWQYMNMEKPKRFGVYIEDKSQDLLGELKEKRYKNYSYWEAFFNIKQPGSYIFYVEPSPYWEPAEEKFIIHYTKVVVNALGKEDGWDKEIGLKTEIVPLTRPFGLWAGNVFQGIVKVDGRPVPFAEVEVEFYNPNGRIKAPDEPFITQVVKSDANGVFTYAIPKAGWWGFAAISLADYKLKRNGKDYPVEIGAVLWVRTREMK